VIGAVALVGAPAAIVVATAGPASADTFTVTTTTDGGSGSLREAIEDLAVNAGGDTVVLQPAATYELTCGEGGDLSHGSTPLIIEGNGATIEQTCGGQRVLDQGAGPLVLGGGISMLGGEGSALIEDSTLTGNTARNGGAIGVAAGTQVQVVNSTITDNHADGGPGTGTGGALDSNGGGGFVFTYATIVGNTANSGGNNLSIGSESDILVVDSVIADGDCSLNGNAVTSANNVTTETSCGLADATDTLVTDPMLAPLGAYGGPTLTMQPASSASPVVGVVPPAECGAGQDGITTDQRDFARPAVGLAAPDDGGACDAGAVEYSVPTDDLPLTPLTPPAAAPIAVTPAFTG
jgi:hypothetical protein